jgi:hypothetical protein
MERVERPNLNALRPPPQGKQGVILSMSDIYFTTDDLAARYIVEPDTIRDWARRGVIPPPEKLGNKCCRWRREVIEASDAARAAKAAARAARRYRPRVR